MIDIVPQIKDSVELTREYEVDEPEALFYVEKETSFIYEVRLFPEYALLRLAMPDYQPPVTRIDLIAFTKLFDEYHGDHKEIRSFLFGSESEAIVVTKKRSVDDDRDG